MNDLNHYLEEILGIDFPKGIKISNATNSTEKVKKDSIFFGLPGSNCHGSKYINKALDLGASIAIHNDINYKSTKDNVYFIEDLETPYLGRISLHKSQRNKVFEFLNFIYDEGNKRPYPPKIHAFTGTNGKTSTAYLCHQLLNHLGYDSLYIGTLGVQHNDSNINKSFTSKTTPDMFEYFEILNFYKNKFSQICIELSSHALDQNRLKFIEEFVATSILNIEKDHLDYHKTEKAYQDTKFKIFNLSLESIKIIDEDLKGSMENYKSSADINNITFISNKNRFSDIYYKIIESSIEKTTFLLTQKANDKKSTKKNIKRFKFTCNLFPDFNIHNLVFALSSLGSLEEFFNENIDNDLSFLDLPKGRSELITNISSNVIIDYAHNPGAFNFFLSSLEKYFENLVVVFGCGGNRDKSKRSEMLKIAIKHASKVIFTSDNLRDECFDDIYQDAIENNTLEKVIPIRDREKAIMHGSTLIGENDCLAILGKGHEETQEENGKISFFSDHKVVNEIYK